MLVLVDSKSKVFKIRSKSFQSETWISFERWLTVPWSIWISDKKHHRLFNEWLYLQTYYLLHISRVLWVSSPHHWMPKYPVDSHSFLLRCLVPLYQIETVNLVIYTSQCLMDFFLNVREIQGNMNWNQFKDPLSYLCRPCSLTHELTTSNNIFTNILSLNSATRHR